MDVPAGVSNVRFAKMTGVDHTTASRLRTGDRRPSTDVVAATARAFRLTGVEVAAWLEAIEAGAEASGAWLRDNIFNRDLEPEAVEPESA